MPRGKGKRQHPDLKFAAMIKKKFKHRSEPPACENCKYSVLADSVPEERSSAVGDHEIACTKHDELVIFGVDRGDTCDVWEKKRKPRKPKVKKEEGTEKEPEKKAQAPQKKKKTDKKK